MHQLRRVLPGERATVAAARRLTGSWMQELGEVASLDPAICDDLLLIVSELVTNSISAGASSIELQLSLHQPIVNVNVLDDGAGWPTPRNASITDPHGRGLKIVAALADSWGATRAPDGRTGVWARVRL